MFCVILLVCHVFTRLRNEYVIRIAIRLNLFEPGERNESELDQWLNGIKLAPSQKREELKRFSFLNNFIFFQMTLLSIQQLYYH